MCFMYHDTTCIISNDNIVNYKIVTRVPFYQQLAKPPYHIG